MSSCYYCEHGTDLCKYDCRKCDEIDRDSFARRLSGLSNEAFHAALAEYDRDNERKVYK